jgi:phosphomannomutase/phosphoglucomutase
VPARTDSPVADTAEFAALTDSDLFDLSPDDLTARDTSAAAALPGKIEIASSIFRSYDIRGIAHEALSVEAVGQIGRAIGAEAQALGQQTVVVARDGRNSSPALSAALTSCVVSSSI